MSRAGLALLAALGCALSAPHGVRAERLPETGLSDPRLSPFDALMRRFLEREGLPGGALAVVRDGRLVYARGFGWADRTAREPVRPDALMRIASVSKPITAAAVLSLVEDGRIELDGRVYRLLELAEQVPAGAQVDPRWKEITIRQLLQHTAGFDRKATFDPMFEARRIAEAQGVATPPGADDIVRYMLTRPLDFDPGARYTYSNFGYCLLGRLVSRLGGASYEAVARRRVLAPAGITRMRLGRTRIEERAPGEVHYYPDEARAESVLAPTGRAPWPYGGFSLEAMDANGGWIASVVDLVRFAVAHDAPRPRGLLEATSLAALFRRPDGNAGLEDGRPKPVYYGLGWNVRARRAGGLNTWHAGALPGTSSLLVRRHDGLHWAVVFNSRETPSGTWPSHLIDPLLHQAAAAVPEWPETDLFERFAPERPAATR